MALLSGALLLLAITFKELKGIWNRLQMDLSAGKFLSVFYFFYGKSGNE